ncbi:hypothetical protein F383_27233 [Gossypium arboreum]|uniref:Uncharacterized protein n=1 Tax=Gossypium arboreum TaxID=29729 RepID=A0A0B0PDU6_GOSAR|nr:hypothetical protein F383_27233 [Gossypium arboreum]
MMSGLSPEGFVLINKSGLSPKALCKLLNPG